MRFNSLEFVVFFALVYSLYLKLPYRGQNRLLLVASYFFYGWWNWRFLGLLWLSTLVDFWLGKRIHAAASSRRRQALVSASVVLNLSFLGFFKYYNFFASSLQEVLGQFGWSADFATLNIVLPIGISFYTFQSLSYTIDIYRRIIEPTKRLEDYALFVSYFPHLVAGPIVPARLLLPQLTAPRTLTPRQIQEGWWLIYWGLFKKIVIADNLAPLVDGIYRSPLTHSGAADLVAVYAFAFQIYGDFSGYTDIARGLSKLMGIELILNFRFPYFVTNPRDFWRHWHISLSSWLRDYLYVPMGGSRGSDASTCRNLLVTMLLGGLWHGAAWTFVVWGAYHALLLIGYRGWPRPATHIPRALQVFLMFQLTCLGWLIFRAESMAQCSQMLYRMTTAFSLDGEAITLALKTVFLALPLLLMQAMQLRSNDLMWVLRQSTTVRWSIYVAMYYLFCVWGMFGGETFIYFQF